MVRTTRLTFLQILLFLRSSLIWTRCEHKRRQVPSSLATNDEHVHVRFDDRAQVAWHDNSLNSHAKKGKDLSGMVIDYRREVIFRTAGNVSEPHSYLYRLFNETNGHIIVCYESWWSFSRYFKCSKVNRHVPNPTLNSDPKNFLPGSRYSRRAIETCIGPRLFLYCHTNRSYSILVSAMSSAVASFETFCQW